MAHGRASRHRGHPTTTEGCAAMGPKQKHPNKTCLVNLTLQKNYLCLAVCEPAELLSILPCFVWSNRSRHNRDVGDEDRISSGKIHFSSILNEISRYLEISYCIYGSEISCVRLKQWKTMTLGNWIKKPACFGGGGDGLGFFPLAGFHTYYSVNLKALSEKA